MVNNNNKNLTNEKGVDADSSTKNQSSHVKEEEMDFKELYEQSLNQIQYGDITTGKVVQIKDDRVMVDVGWKTEGFIPIGELKDARGNINISVGNAPLTLDASTASGTIAADHGMAMETSSDHHHVHGQLNGGGPAVKIETGSGNIHIQ